MSTRSSLPTPPIQPQLEMPIGNWMAWADRHTHNSSPSNIRPVFPSCWRDLVAVDIAAYRCVHFGYCTIIRIALTTLSYFGCFPRRIGLEDRYLGLTRARRRAETR